MCKYLSAIGQKNGDVFWNPATDSHEHLIMAGGFREPNNGRGAQWVRLEYTTESEADLVDINKYQLRIDQEEPEWLTDTIRESWERKLRVIANDNIVTNKRTILLGGAWVVARGAEVERLVGGTVKVLAGGVVNEVLAGGTVNKVWAGGVVNDVLAGGVVNEVLAGGTVNKVLAGGVVNKVLAGGVVNEVWAGGTVNKVWDGGTVNKVWAGGEIVRDYRRNKE